MIISMLQEMLMGDGQVGKNVRPQVVNPQQPTPEWQVRLGVSNMHVYMERCAL